MKVGDLGTLRITFKSDGVENINDFNAGVMIKNPRILFTPSKEFRQNIIRQLKYASLTDYRKAKGISTGGSGSEGGEGEGEDPSV